MQHFALALLVASLVISTPIPEDDLESRNYQYHWSVTKWQYGRGNNAYDYSFNVQGPPNGDFPGFTASCSGTNIENYKPCTVTAHQGEYISTVSANVDIVIDPNNPNDSIPRVFVQESYTDDQSCTYHQFGHHDATLNEGSPTGTKFSIVPNHATAVC